MPSASACPSCTSFGDAWGAVARNPTVFWCPMPGVKMPGFPQLSEEDLDALARYLEGLKVEGFDFGALPKF